MLLRNVRSFLCVAVVLVLSASASAEIISQYKLVYSGSYSGLDPDTFEKIMVVLPTTGTPDVNGVTHRQIDVTGQPMLYHDFDLVYSASGSDIVVGRDVMYTAVQTQATNGVAYESFVGYKPAINPPKMPTGTGSDASLADAFQLNEYLSAAQVIATSVQEGTLPLGGFDYTGAGNGTYGDYASFLHLGRGTPPQGTIGYGKLIYSLGSLTLTSTGAGTFALSKIDDLKVLYPNTTGLGVPTDKVSAAFTGRYDSVAFVVIPEPSTLILLATGLIGLLCYAWRKRR